MQAEKIYSAQRYFSILTPASKESNNFSENDLIEQAYIHTF